MAGKMYFLSVCHSGPNYLFPRVNKSLSGLAFHSRICIQMIHPISVLLCYFVDGGIYVEISVVEKKMLQLSNSHLMSVKQPDRFMLCLAVKHVHQKALWERFFHSFVSHN